MADFTEAELEVLAGSKRLLDQLLANPKTMRETQKLIKEIHPNVNTIDDNPIMGEVRELAKRFDEDRKERRDREIDNQLDSEFKLLSDEGWQPDGIEKLKRFMVDEGIKSPLNAAAAWDRRNPPQAQPPSLMAPSTWGFGDMAQSDDDKQLFANEDAWAEKEAGKVLQEMRGPERIRT